MGAVQVSADPLGVSAMASSANDIEPYRFYSTDLNHISPCFALSRADGDFSTIAHYNTSQYASVFCRDKKRSLPICWFHLAVHA